MSYTVLARKWRPKNFSELVGQQHVMQALSNALDQQRLHHAYLFTGTRGVGKTTIARIFAKALNCEQGITSKPCGQCATCRSIDEGRFVDLIEVDAASRTKVEDTRELLENVQYAPVQGRFKVYLIDEVHMLSKSSFNALLKTLEEPPEHVKFLLATTDPHKLPITVLSRCLQFNLMRLTPTQIQNHLAYILQQEQVSFEDAALSMIAKSADGSARDSLSILDQAIAYGGGQVMFEPVQAMLGLVDQQFVVKILTALLNQAPQEIKAVMQELSQMGVDYEALNHQLIEAFHQLSLLQVLGALNDLAVVDESFLQQVAQTLFPEKVQVLYQIALLAQQDMRLAPDVRIGFEMALLRMLAFEPAQGGGSGSNVASSGIQNGANSVVAPQSVQAAPKMQPTSMPESNAQAPQQPIASENAANIQSQVPASDSVEQTIQTTPSPVVASQEISPEPSLQKDKDAQHLMSLKEKISQSLGKLQAKNSVKSDVQKEVSSSTALESNVPIFEDSQSSEQQVAEEPVIENTPLETASSEQAELTQSDSFLESIPVEAYENDISSMAVEEQGDVSDSHAGAFNDGQMASAAEAMSHNTVAEQSISNVVEDREEQSTLQPQPEEPVIELPENAESIENWVRLIQSLNIDGWAAELVNQSMLVSYDQQKLVLSIDPEQASAKSDLALSKLTEVVQQRLGCELVYVETQGEHYTPAKYWQHQKQLQQQDAVQSIYQDPSIQGFVDILNMRVIDSSIQSLGKTQ
ncbi:DNA polymerase III subunit gamma/tau [Hydrogenovibrio kuenenii]|uniref:DNA polymerase III subunit gamma/tau n=1 Tax=Hydrogenovibrio kuenenii TaxID=63658 RepID=UPI0004647527|nr:DNA polymerase III subunit gamma/tau [Hydrogenovibrio kuenenii]